MRLLISILSALIIYSSYAQNEDCDNRYQSEIFQDVSVQTVTYSDNYNLLMDVYTPVGDTYTNRPLLIFAHGGVFIGGSKTNPTMINLCESFAKRGFVTASINYRLATHSSVLGAGGILWMMGLDNGIKVLYSAMSDAKAAIRFFRKDFVENLNSYGIDPNQIWMGGSSAGAALALHLNFVNSAEEFLSGIDESSHDYVLDLLDQNGGLEGLSGNLGYSSEINGLINLAGALHNLEWIDSTDLNPVVSCHGTDDETVPADCSTIYDNPLFLSICGSQEIHPVLDELLITNSYLPFVSEGHVPWEYSSAIREEMVDFVGEFIYQNINCQLIKTIDSQKTKTLMYQNDLLGRQTVRGQSGFVFNFYNDGTILKTYIFE